MNKVSIVIPVYNAEKYLAECIESALNQTYKDIEIIAVNDGSTDNSLQILNKYADRIKIISKENGGTASALNTAIMAATGEWIKTLDSDDILYPDAVEVLVSKAKDLPEKTSTIFYANWDLMDSNGKIITRHSEPNYNNLSKFDYNVILLDHHIGNQDATLYHKSIFEKFGYFDGKYGYEDLELKLRFCLLHNCGAYFIPKSLAKYRIHQNQISFANPNEVEYLEKIRNNILSQLDPTEREKYRIALEQYRKDMPVMQKMKHSLGRWLVENMPTPIADKIRMLNFRFIEGQSHDTKLKE